MDPDEVAGDENGGEGKGSRRKHIRIEHEERKGIVGESELLNGHTKVSFCR